MESMLYKHFYNIKHAKQIKVRCVEGREHFNIITQCSGCSSGGIHRSDPDIVRSETQGCPLLIPGSCAVRPEGAKHRLDL